MPRNSSNPPSNGTAGSSGIPESPGGGMRPPSRAMSVSSAGGRSTNDGPIANGYPMPASSLKHPQTPGTPQMGHGFPQHQSSNSLPHTPQHLHAQYMHQGSPPPVRPPSAAAAPGSPIIGVAPSMRRGSPMSAQPIAGATSAMGTPASGRGTPNPLKRKASGLDSPKMGSLSGNSLHYSSLEAMDRPGSSLQNGISGKAASHIMSLEMEMARPGTAPGFSPSTPSPMPGSNSQRESTPSSVVMPTLSPSDLNSFLQKDESGLNSISKPTRIGSLPPSSTEGIATTEISGTTATSQAAAGLVSGNSMNGPVKVVPKVPPLPANVSLNPLVTEVKVVPVAGSDKTIPLLTADEIEDIKQWQKVDSTYEEMYKAMREKMELELKGHPRSLPRDIMSLLDAGEFGSIGGKGGVLGNASIKWWEKGSYSVNPGARFRQRRERFDIKYPSKGRRENHGRTKEGIKREGFRIPRRLSIGETDRPEQLVLIRLEFDVDHHKYRDTFVWNLSDPIVTPEIFAQSVVEDYQLAPSYHPIIVKNIQEQLSDYKAHSALYDGEGGDYLGDDNNPSFTENGALDEADAAWWESWRKRLRTEFGFAKAGKGLKGKRKRNVGGVKEELAEDADIEDANSLLDEKSMAVEDFEIDEGKMTEDMRIMIKLDIIVGSMKLDDQFEWDIDNVKASPEQFAEIYTQDLGLSGEFRSAIAHSIREQVQTYHKSLFLVGRPSDGSIQDEELRSAFLPSLAEGARAMDQVQSFTPLLNYLSDGEVERNEKERDKDVNRRRKRNTRGRRGVNLPDREPIRTHRTPAIGFPELDPATLALAAAANAPVSRRAAAAAASLTIANMVASENGTPFTPLSAPAVPQPAATAINKEKKVKGLFKAPQIPPSVFRPRAKVSAPTPSTAADVSTLPAPLENDPPPSINTPDRRFLRPLTARKPKDSEREAKEREYAEGQHANHIDGVWHCSNCGCPESIAIGRRKGPLGNKSQCGDCGRFWHRHRRPRPCTYSTDAEYHISLTKKKGSAATLRAQDSSVSTPMDDLSAPPTPARDRKKERSEAPSRQSPPASRRALREDDRAVSPISSSSSASEPPLSQRVKLTNGTAGSPRVSPSPSRVSKSTDAGESRNSKDPITKNEPEPSTPPRTNVQSPPTSPTKAWPPSWLTTTMHSTQTKYPNDKFDVVWRKVGEGSEWRIKCVDCPGKLYKPGPGETLANFEVHLKNRQHRQRVDDRIGR
ncbi:hypothetical protein F5050DRAFT_723799 [Lentinula boryana]|uniref:SNF5-domain-containing protein n=1 Tax=Lentinula boryana TaxID=40481 RepID=A0ABQ8Q3Q5_9AGAR|nr:hypothetical protein F5050DRAFT_723799 [Lentinula boryana]